MTLAAYNGHETLTFTDYLDLATGKTLRAEPGRTYDVAPASGRVIPEFPEPWFTPVVQPHSGFMLGSSVLAGEGAPAEGDGAPEPSEEAGEPAHDEDPETDAPQ